MSIADMPTAVMSTLVSSAYDACKRYVHQFEILDLYDNYYYPFLHVCGELATNDSNSPSSVGELLEKKDLLVKRIVQQCEKMSGRLPQERTKTKKLLCQIQKIKNMV
jgi:hypothetical protein